MIYFLVGPSSSGKDSFYEYIAKKYDLDRIVLHTTRPMREGEVEGQTYFFISKEEMDKMDNNGELIERRNYDTKYGIWSYATHRDSIDISKNYVVINTWEAYQKFMDFLGKDNVFPIYFELDPKVRYERALARERQQKQPKFDELRRRFEADSYDFREELKEKYQPYIIDNNGTIEETQKQIDKLLLARKIGVR